jgi:hypothetical protein
VYYAYYDTSYILRSVHYNTLEDTTVQPGQSSSSHSVLYIVLQSVRYTKQPDIYYYLVLSYYTLSLSLEREREYRPGTILSLARELSNRKGLLSTYPFLFWISYSLSYPALSCPILAYPTVLYPTLPYLRHHRSMIPVLVYSTTYRYQHSFDSSARQGKARQGKPNKQAPNKPKTSHKQATNKH